MKLIFALAAAVLAIGGANGLEKMGENAGKEAGKSAPQAAAAVALVAALALGALVYLRRKK